MNRFTGLDLAWNAGKQEASGAEPKRAGNEEQQKVDSDNAEQKEADSGNAESEEAESSGNSSSSGNSGDDSGGSDCDK